ncbi:MAG TPA: ABC transporter permease subunit, partial [Desulfuromonadales bacterium]|nr:ABC transporter permease subunit [Desulfuromonadales bacterium]
MKSLRLIFTAHAGEDRRFGLADLVVLSGLLVATVAGLQLAWRVPAAVKGPTISLAPGALPWYAALSISRMSAAYFLSLVFTLVYGYLAANHRRAERILMPLLDVLQSVPILSFLPVALLGLSAVLPQRTAAEIASVILIFTSQVWNMTFGWYQSLTTLPKELREASTIFRFGGWQRFKTAELPFAVIPLIWNSIMSWSGGWFFLMAAEIFHVGKRDFRLPGLGSYLQEAANQGDIRAILLGLAWLIGVIVALDQLVWRPLLAWGNRFKVDLVEGEEPPNSWFYELLSQTRFPAWVAKRFVRPLMERFDVWMLRLFPPAAASANTRGDSRWQRGIMEAAGWGIFGLALAYGLWQGGHLLGEVTAGEWWEIVRGVGATFLRVAGSLVLALLWTIPLGVMIGTNARLARWLQPLVQIAASTPATALFPIFLLLVIGLPGGLNLAAVLLMLMGTQWYLLFNVIAGAMAIPNDLRYTASLLQLSRWERWRTLFLPALFPYIVTGSITA